MSSTETTTAPAVKTKAKAPAGKVTIPYADPANEAQWADDFLTYIDAPTTKPNLEFITAAEEEEGTFYPSASFIPRQYGDSNKNNPLDSTQFEAGGVVWADNGGDPVWQFPTLQAGLESNAAIIEHNPGDYDLLEALREGKSSANELAADVAASDWGTGGGPGSEAEVGYSGELAGELQSALESVNSGLTSPGKTAVLTSFPGGSLDPLNWPSEAAGAAESGVESFFKTYVLPYAFEGLGVLFGGILIVLGAWKSAGREANKSPTVGNIVNVAQKAPELAEAGAA